MILTYKRKHYKDLSVDLAKAKQVALFALKTKSRSSKDVKDIGLKSVISNQILKKYSSNKKLKRISSVKLTIPAQGIKREQNKIRIPSLDLEMTLDKEIEKIHQIELDSTYAYISCKVKEEKPFSCTSWIGIDLNTTGHCLTAANPTTGKVLKLGKKAYHIHKKYKTIRKRLQKKKRYSAVKKRKNKESRIVRDLNHKISRKIVLTAKSQNAGVVLEDLQGIRKTAKTSHNFKYALNSWSFYQLKSFIEYKAKLHGVTVAMTDPRYSSKQCSRCGLLGERRGKLFKCPCGHVDHADVNAPFVLSLRHQGMLQSLVDRDTGEGRLARPARKGRRKDPTSEPHLL